MASFHLIIKIPSCRSPLSFNYRSAACSKHVARFLIVQETLHFHIPCVSFIPLIDFLGNSVLILSSYSNASLVLFLWTLRTLALSLISQVIQLGFMCDPSFVPLRGLSVIQARAQISLTGWLLSKTHTGFLNPGTRASRRYKKNAQLETSCLAVPLIVLHPPQPDGHYLGSSVFYWLCSFIWGLCFH